MDNIDLELLIKQLDESFNNGIGHVNVKVDANQNVELKIEQVENCCGLTACQSPTLMEGLDNMEEE